MYYSGLLNFLSLPSDCDRHFVTNPRNSMPPSLLLKTEGGQVSETSCFLVFENSGRWTRTTKSVVLLYTIVRTLQILLTCMLFGLSSNGQR
jgi:hypothetical protein